MNETIFTAVVTAIAGAVASVWSYWTGRKKRASEISVSRSEALHELNETIDLQCKKINDLHEIILQLKDELLKSESKKMELLANQECMRNDMERLREEIVKLRNELDKYKKQNSQVQRRIINEYKDARTEKQ